MNETLRTFRWWCPSCERTGTFDIQPEFADTFPQEVAPDAHALDVFMDESDKPYCDGGAFEISEVFNVGGACPAQGQLGRVASPINSPPAPLTAAQRAELDAILDEANRISP